MVDAENSTVISRSLTLCFQKVNLLHKMKYLVICVLCLIALCEGDNFFCQLVDKSTKTLEFYCKHFTGTLPENCSTDITLNNPLEVRHLKMCGCEISAINYAVEICSNLRSIDISHSGYKSLDVFNFGHPNIEKINVSHNAISTIHYRFLEKFPNVTEVDFSHNAVQSVDSTDYNGPSNLKRVNLSHNSKFQPKFGDFDNLKIMEMLDLSSNNMNELGIPHYSRLYNLEAIHVENNPITSFTNHTVSCNGLFFMGSSTKRKYVYFSWQHVQILNTNCKKAKYHVVLNSEHEGLIMQPQSNDEIHCRDQSFKNITKFIAGNNKIDNLMDLLRCFESSTIEIMDLSGNKLGPLNESTFSRFVKLKELYLKNTKLVEFDFDILRYQTKLTVLDLSHNYMQRVINVSVLSTFENLMIFTVAGSPGYIILEISPNLPAKTKVV